MKRLAVEESRDSKRQRTHLTICDDPSCDGCDVGEIDIELAKDMTAMDIYALAKEEMSKLSLSSEDIDSSTHSHIIQKLFEMAIAQFQSEQTTLAYCNCLYDFAKFMSIHETMEQAKVALEELLRSDKDKSAPSTDHQAWLLLGRIYLELAGFGYTDAQSDEEDTVVPPKPILELVKKCVHSFRKVSAI
jgi:hypothetical protein